MSRWHNTRFGLLGVRGQITNVVLGGGIDRKTAGDAITPLKRKCRGDGEVSASTVAPKDKQTVIRCEII